MEPIPNIQQLLDNHVHDSLVNDWGSGASGDNWIEDPDNNVKNKYAVTREYRTLNPSEIEEMVKGSVASNLGTMIITNVRLVYEPIHLLGKTFGVRYETILYAAAMNSRVSQIGGSRVTYEMVRDFMQTLTDNPFTINNTSIRFVLQAAESEFATTELDVQRLIAIIPTSTLRRV